MRLNENEQETITEFFFQKMKFVVKSNFRRLRNLNKILHTLCESAFPIDSERI